MASTYAEVLELAVAIELECAALYEVFAKRFAKHSEQVYFWRLYAEAERYHAASIRIHQAALAAMGPTGEQAYDGEAVAARAFLEDVRGHRSRYEQEPLGIVDALRCARMVEEHSAELHGRTQFFTEIPEFGDILQKMAEEDRAHRDVLASAEKRWA